MSTHEHSRRAHELVDAIKDGYTPDRADVDFLRSFLPELPKQKTLEEIHKYVDDVWLEADDPESKEWLHELHAQLQGLKDTPATVPALPAGMRIAEHEDYGRVVAAPIADSDGERMIFCLDKTSLTGAGRCWAHEDSLTFIAAEPDKSAHPEFLETEADYKDAPDGTTVARGSSSPWVKQGTVWENVAFDGKFSKDLASVPRRVLRWGNE